MLRSVTQYAVTLWQKITFKMKYFDKNEGYTQL